MKNISKERCFVLTEDNQELLEKNGWRNVSMGRTTQINYDARFTLLVRERNLKELIEQRSKEKNDEISKNSSKDDFEQKPKNADKMGAFEECHSAVSNRPMVMPKEDLTPSERLVENLTPAENRKTVSDDCFQLNLSKFDQFPSLAAIRSEEDAIMIACDTEWSKEIVEGKNARFILSWQFACINKGNLVEFVFYRKNKDHMLKFEVAIGTILDYLKAQSVDVRKVRKYMALGKIDQKTGIPQEKMFNSYSDAEKYSQYLYADGRPVHCKNDYSKTKHLRVGIICHAGKFDLSAFDQSNKGDFDVLKRCTEIQGGLVYLKPAKIYPKSLREEYAVSKNTHTYPVLISFSDTMCHAPAKKKKLADLGLAVGWEKLKVKDEEKEHMDVLLANEPLRFTEYASNDSVITLLYAASLYGINKIMPISVTGASASVLQKTLMEELGCKTKAEFNRVYRGLKTVSHGLVLSEDRAGFLESTSLEAISDKAKLVQRMTSEAYYGGYNGSFDIGYFPFVTFDYDLKNAYPTVMSLIRDINWEDPIRYEIKERVLVLDDFKDEITGKISPVTPLVAYVRFEFPPDVKFPCIPIRVDGIPIYSLTSNGVDGGYVAGPDLYLALKLGAKVYVESGYVLRCLKNTRTGKASCSLRAGVKKLVEDRKLAKKVCGNDSLEELIIKVMVNSGYGKVAQNVIEKSSWSAYKECMEIIGCSAITNPVSACMITSLVRAELIAAQNQCAALGYMTCSVTTDGFISNIEEENLKKLDLYGIREFVEEARCYLTDGEDSEIWEIKHAQNDLVNFTTRGNVSLYSKTNKFSFNGKEYKGVCAHNSTKSGFESESYIDRKWLMKNVLERTGPVTYKEKVFTTFKNLSRGTLLTEKEVERDVHMDFDMKRKPLRDSFVKTFVMLDDIEYEIVNFTTIPFESIEEYSRYRELKKSSDCLKTIQEWERFFFRIEKGKECKVKSRNPEWSKLYSCIVGHRRGLWTIPMLNILEGSERLAWISSFVDKKTMGKSSFTVDDWKNAGRSSRQKNILPREMCSDLLNEMIRYEAKEICCEALEDYDNEIF